MDDSANWTTRGPAISLWQPWASLIAVGRKNFETRSWSPSPRLIGQRIAIHAAKKQVSVRDLTEELHEACLDEFGCSYNYTLPRGALVCTVILQSVHRVETVPPDALGDYSPGRFAWCLTDVEPFEPVIPWRGAQGFFQVDIDRARTALETSHADR